MTRQTGRRGGDTPLRRFAGRLYVDALQRAELRRRELEVADRFPTVAVAIALDELEALLDYIERPVEPLVIGRIARFGNQQRPLPAGLSPLVRELAAVLEQGRRVDAAGDPSSNGAA